MNGDDDMETPNTPSASSSANKPLLFLQKKRLIGIGAATVVVAAIVIYGVFFYERSVNFVIPSVPYHGYYNHFHDAFYPPATAVLSIARFYGDESITPRQLMESMYHQPGSFYWTEEFETDLQSFGYDTIRLYEAKGKALNAIRKFVNPETATPVLALIRYEEEESVRGFNDWVVVIGVRDDTDEVILHDFFYGNSRVISQQAFEYLAVPDNMLVLTPTKDIPESSNGEVNGDVELGRLPVMEDAAPLLVKRAIFLANNPTSDTEGSFETLERIVESEVFDDLHPGFQVVLLQNMAMHYIQLRQPEEAIQLIEERVLPINSNLAADFNGWSIVPQKSYPSLREDHFASPYVILGNAYAAQGDTEKAQELYDEAFALQPNYVDEIEFLNEESLYPAF